MYVDGHEEESVECMLQDEDTVPGHGYFMQVNGLPPNFVVENGVGGGDKTLFVEGAKIDESKYEIILPADPVFEVRSTLTDEQLTRVL